MLVACLLRPWSKCDRPSSNAPPKKKRCRNVARVKNQEHQKLGLHASTTPGGRKADKLARVKQSYLYDDIVNMTEKQSEMLLRDAGVLPQGRTKILCWECGSTMSAASSSSSGHGQPADDVAQCPQCRTSSRHKLQLANASFAWTPFWSGLTRGYTPQFNMFLRVLFLVSVARLSNSLPAV